MHQHYFKVQTSWQVCRKNVGNVKGEILSENISIPAS
ncbi:peroxiredoxin, partial [Staphylococcus aureus]|nr:peroxiredoxin [Staphylococcus aureus]